MRRRSLAVLVRHAVALAATAAPVIGAFEASCGPGDPASDAAPSGCNVTWQGPVAMSCFVDPFFYSGPVATGTMADPSACGLADAAATAAQCASICGAYGPICIANGNSSTIYCTDTTDIHPDTLCGRRPRGLRQPRPRRSTAALLAHAAHLEAASVIAFERLHSELVSHGAPRSLQRAALRARRDEQRHARMTERLARRRGATAATPSCAAQADRDLLTIAIENVVEGCVRETYGAAVATWQAEHAPARDVRAVMQSIAPDEVRHAALAWRVARWVDDRLDARGRQVVREMGRRAVQELRRNAAGPANAELGLPHATTAQRILNQLSIDLWDPAFPGQP